MVGSLIGTVVGAAGGAPPPLFPPLANCTEMSPNRERRNSFTVPPSNFPLKRRARSREDWCKTERAWALKGKKQQGRRRGGWGVH